MKYVYKCPECECIEVREEETTLKCPSCDDVEMVELAHVSEWTLKQRFDGWLDEVYPPVKIGAYEYAVSTAMKLVDEIAHRQEFLGWLDAEVTEGKYTDEIGGEHYEMH
jgi:ssDNA-binding Zn-finger/Zn-ribbon topoisomerase 1